MAITFIAATAASLFSVGVAMADRLVTFQAESGAPGSNFTNGADGAVQYISISTDTVNNGNPGNVNRVATYTVVFPEAGTFNLFARMRVGPNTFNDDSLFYGNGFGAKSPTTDGDWIFVNGLASAGYTASGELVDGVGSAGSQVWKWVNLSQFTNGVGESPLTFTVSAGTLTQTFHVGARENGLDLDKFAFGTTGTSFAVSDLDSGIPPDPPPLLTNVFIGPDGFAFHRFSPLNNGINADGANPAAGLALSGGVLCGTTLNGGAQGAGTAFYLSADSSNFVTFRSFASAPDANNPQGEFSVSGNGLFGTSFAGGGGGVGTVFIGQTNGNVSLLRSFSTVHDHTGTNSGGASPSASLVLSGGTIYGTTTAGGAAVNGTVVSVGTNGLSFSVLHNFSVLNSQTGTNNDGAMPWGGLILGGDKLYGTASAGGAGGNGVVFSIGTTGMGFATLHNFSPMDTLAATNSDGAIPYGGLVLSNGTLYGTTFAGGHGGRGTIYSLQTNGSGFTVLHHFSATDSVTRTNTDGASPSAGLVLSSNALCGTASAGGAGAAGTVFSLNLGSTQFNTLHSFAALASNGTNTDGAFPAAPVLRLGSSLYGTTFSGGPGGVGTVFGIPLSAPPAVITNIVNNGDGSVTLYFLGGANTTNVIQSTTSLTAPAAWQDISTNTADVNGAWQFTNSNDGINNFYRSYVP